MARIARAVAPGVPHHVTQRGNRRQTTFFREQDYADYLALLRAHCAGAGVAVWAYCLMPNHVHLVLVPATEDGLALALGETHRRYSWAVNRREGWRGYLWQGRFGSAALDEAHLLAAARYVELNPVRARLVARPQDWAWSSARAHLAQRDDALVAVAPLLYRVGHGRADWADFLAAGLAEEDAEALRRGERTGRPLGSVDFVQHLEDQLGRRLLPQKRGPKPKAGGE